MYYTVVSREENWQKSKMKITVPQVILNACLVFCSQIVTEKNSLRMDCVTS